MGNRINTQVLIVGGGPVGLTLAIDLAQRGIHVTVAETRAGGEPPSVKCNHVAARTMEIFRGSSGLVAAHLPKVQNRRNPARCQAMTVSGLTMVSAERQPRQRRGRQIHNRSSAEVNFRRFAAAL
jgi:2-polyprenyl-6-methoxyphenol hydroxylase-like FAD-dependent oxidoreductase